MSLLRYDIGLVCTFLVYALTILVRVIGLRSEAGEIVL
jgi:hypothetical protein